MSILRDNILLFPTVYDTIFFLLMIEFSHRVSYNKGVIKVVVETLINKVVEDGREFTYVYKLLKNDFVMEVDGNQKSIQAYGIEVERQDLLDGQVIQVEKDYEKYISPQRHKVRSLMKLLNDNIVSPVHLIDIIGEYIDEYISDFDKELNGIANC